MKMKWNEMKWNDREERGEFGKKHTKITSLSDFAVLHV